jgi:hypothetical protein
MKLSLNKLKLKQEIDRTEVLNWGIFFFLLLGLFYETLHDGEWFSFIFMVLVIAGYALFLRRLLQSLYYSFWTFFGVLGVYSLFKLCQQPLLSMNFVAFLAASVLIGIQCYSLWTPIFYPIVSWWEYDFRYRDDLKVQVTYNDEKVEGRLTDLRRGAGCVASFRDYKLGEYLELEPFDEVASMKFRAEIMSKRKYSVGRPFNYGVRFVLEEDGVESLFKNFVKFWRSERKLKQKKKFKNEQA